MTNSFLFLRDAWFLCCEPIFFPLPPLISRHCQFIHKMYRTHRPPGKAAWFNIRFFRKAENENESQFEFSLQLILRSWKKINRPIIVDHVYSDIFIWSVNEKYWNTSCLFWGIIAWTWAGKISEKNTEKFFSYRKAFLEVMLERKLSLFASYTVRRVALDSECRLAFPAEIISVAQWSDIQYPWLNGYILGKNIKPKAMLLYCWKMNVFLKQDLIEYSPSTHLANSFWQRGVKQESKI